MNNLFLIPFLGGIIFILAGIIMCIFPPKKINSFYGYRLQSAMKSQERWVFAQSYSAKQMMKLGSLLALTSTSGLLFKVRENAGAVIGLILLFATVALITIQVEAAIKRKFDDENELSK